MSSYEGEEVLPGIGLEGGVSTLPEYGESVLFSWGSLSCSASGGSEGVLRDSNGFLSSSMLMVSLLPMF